MIGVVVLAREDSERLPRKHLYPIDGAKSALEVLLQRIKGGFGVADEYVVATPSRLYGDLAKACGWDVYLSQAMPLERVWRASLGWGIVAVVNGDSPLIEWNVIEQLLKLQRGIDMAYCSGPSGMRAKVIAGKALNHWYRWVEAQAEHVLSGLTGGSGLVAEALNLGPCAERFTIDDYDDVRFIRYLCQELGTDCPAQDYIRFVGDNPNVRASLAQGHTGVNRAPS